MNIRSGAEQLNKLLADMNFKEDYPISVLTDAQGLTVAWAANQGMDPERQSAVVAFVQKTAVQVSKQLGMASTDEISLFDMNGQKLVCRPFTIDGTTLILAVMVADRNTSYRRATNHAIYEIRRIWKTFWR